MSKKFVLGSLAPLLFAVGCRQFALLNYAPNEEKEISSTQRVQLPLKPNSRLVESRPTPKNWPVIQPSNGETDDSGTFVAERIAKLKQPPKTVDIGVPPLLPKVVSAPTAASDDDVEWLAVGDIQTDANGTNTSANPAPDQPKTELAVEPASQPPAPVVAEKSSSNSESPLEDERSIQLEQPPSPSDAPANDPATATYDDLKSENAARQIAACGYLRSTGSPNHIPHLTPLLRHENTDVVIACTQALGECGPWVHPEPVAETLISGDLPVQKAAAIALCELGSSMGPSAIEQMSQSLNPAVRSTAAQCAGELADPLFTPMLIRLLNDATQARLAALKALPKCTGVNIPGEGDPSVLAEKWRSWYLRGGRGASINTDG